MSSSDASSSVSSSTSETSKRGVKRKRDIAPAPQKVVKTGKNTLQKANGNSNPASDDTDSDDSDSGSDEDEETLEDSQVLSHAAQRKLKRKAEKAAQLSSSHPAKELLQDGAGGGIPKRQNSIWVGNLAFKTTEQSLRAFFTRGVPGCEVTRVNLPTKTGKDVGGGKGMRGENRGFAYVDFATKEAKEQAIALSEHNLDGRKLLIKDGGDFTGRPTTGPISGEAGATAGAISSMVGKSKTAQRILAAQKQPPGQTLFLGNLGFHATEDAIKSMIEGHMRPRRDESSKDISNEDAEQQKTEATSDKKWVRKVRLGTFEDSGLCKGWAFVDFFNTEDATAVLLDPRNHHLDGRKLVVEYGSPDAVRRGGGPGARSHGDKKKLPKEKGDGRGAGKQGRTEPESQDRSDIHSEAKDLENHDEPRQKRLKVSEDKGHEARRGKVRRTKPGAALALAKREQVAIVPSSGKKIVF